MKALLILLIGLFFVQELPLKPTDEFEIKLDYKFKQRVVDYSSTVHLSETQRERDRRMSSALLPFLTLNVKMLKLPALEKKVDITNNINGKVITRKISEGTILPIEVGFTDDAKDRISAHEYVLTFIRPDKTESNKVVIFIEEDGTFLVNGEKRGKF